MIASRALKLGIACVSVLLAALIVAVVVQFELLDGDPDPGRFSDLIGEFAQEEFRSDSTESPIVFVGSSSIRGWHLDQSFPGLPILNRGMGGAELSDIIFYIDELVLNHEPYLVVVYAGENDIAGGKSSASVFEDYQRFTDLVRAHLPDTPIIYISIKPTPRHRSKWSKMDRANQLIRDYASSDSRLEFVDVSSKMMILEGQLVEDFYAEDRLHLSREGYALWTRELSHLLHN